MALLLETTLGDLVIDLDIEGSPEICKNILKLAKARYYTSTLVYNIQPNRFCQLGDPQGDGSGGACIHGLIATLLSSEDGNLDHQRVLRSPQRFLNSNMGRPLNSVECQQKGRVVATEMKGIPNTIGSQLLITTCEGKDMALDGYQPSNQITVADGNGEQTRPSFRSVGIVEEDENGVLDQVAAAYCDAEGRPYADIRIIRALVIDDPFEDPPGMENLLKERGVIFDERTNRVTKSPERERPPEEKVEIRIQADQVDPLTGEEDAEKLRAQEEELLKREDKSRAVVLEMLGDLPDADIKAPENVLFVCKLNPVTEDEDLELIFSRFDEKVKAEIIRDQDTGSSLQYAFVEFTKKEQAVEAYFKMNNALVDDRRIKVDFSQSVAKVWNKYTQRSRTSSGKGSNQGMPRDPYASNVQRGARTPKAGKRDSQTRHSRDDGSRRNQRHEEDRLSLNDRDRDGFCEKDIDQFGRRRDWGGQQGQAHDKRLNSRENEHFRPNRREGDWRDREHRSSRRYDSENDEKDYNDKKDRHRHDRRRRRSRSRDYEDRHRKHHKSYRSRRNRYDDRDRNSLRPDSKNSVDNTSDDDDAMRDVERQKEYKRDKHDEHRRRKKHRKDGSRRERSGDRSLSSDSRDRDHGHRKSHDRKRDHGRHRRSHKKRHRDDHGQREDLERSKYRRSDS